MNTEKLTAAGINVPELLNRIMNNEMLLKLILKKFLEDKTFDALTAAASERNKEMLEHSSHTLKGMCGNLSHTNLFELFKTQVIYIRENELDVAVGMMDKIRDEYQNAKAGIQAWLDENL